MRELNVWFPPPLQAPKTRLIKTLFLSPKVAAFEKRTIFQSRQWRNNWASAHVANRVREGKRGLINEKKEEEEEEERRGGTYAAGLVSFGGDWNANGWAHAIAESWPGREISDFISASSNLRQCLKSTKNHRSPVHPARGNGTSWREHRNISSSVPGFWPGVLPVNETRFLVRLCPVVFVLCDDFQHASIFPLKADRCRADPDRETERKPRSSLGRVQRSTEGYIGWSNEMGRRFKIFLEKWWKKWDHAVFRIIFLLECNWFRIFWCLSFLDWINADGCFSFSENLFIYFLFFERWGTHSHSRKINSWKHIEEYRVIFH